MRHVRTAITRCRAAGGAEARSGRSDCKSGITSTLWREIPGRPLSRRGARRRRRS
jgi:hypothetical protein